MPFLQVGTQSNETPTSNKWMAFSEQQKKVIEQLEEVFSEAKKDGNEVDLTSEPVVAAIFEVLQETHKAYAQVEERAKKLEALENPNSKLAIESYKESLLKFEDFHGTVKGSVKKNLGIDNIEGIVVIPQKSPDPSVFINSLNNNNEEEYRTAAPAA